MTQGIQCLQFGEPPASDLNGGGDAAEIVREAVVMIAHRAVWLGENGRLVYDLAVLEDGDGCPVLAMRIVVTVTPGE